MTQEELINAIQEVINSGDCSEDLNMEKIRNLFSEFNASLAELERLRIEQAGA